MPPMKATSWQQAGVSYTVGREANAQYGETLNGMRAETPKHQFTVPVDPYVKPGDPASGLLPFVQPGDGGQPGRRGSPRAGLQFPALLHEDSRPTVSRTGRRRSTTRRGMNCWRATSRRSSPPAANRSSSEFWNPDLDAQRQDRHQQQRRFLHRLHRRQLRLPGGDYAARRARIWQAHEDYIRASSISWPPARACPRPCGPKCRSGGRPRTSSSPPPAGRISSMCAKRGAWFRTT